MKRKKAFTILEQKLIYQTEFFKHYNAPISALFSLVLSNPNEPLVLTCDSNLKKLDRVNINEGNTYLLSMLYRVFITLVVILQIPCSNTFCQ